MESFWLAVTNLGRDEVFIVALALYTWLLCPRGGRDLGVAFALSFLVNTALKYGLNLPRPFTSDPSLASEAAQATAGGSGLPSGHTQMSLTLWGGMAAQLRQPIFTGFALVLVALIALSRLVLHVHFPSDVLVGALLGLVFALWAARGNFPLHAAGRWTVPALALLAGLLFPHAPRELGTGLGLLAGFWAARPDFSPPRDWTGRLIVAGAGLLVVFAVYLGLGALPVSVKDLAVVRVLRYALLVLVAAEGVPRLLRRWLPRVTSR